MKKEYKQEDAFLKEYPNVSNQLLKEADVEYQWYYLLEHNRRDDAVELFRQHPDDLRDDYSDLLLEEKKYEEAIAVLDDGIQTHEDDELNCCGWMVDKEIEILEYIEDKKYVVEKLQWLFIHSDSPVSCYEKLKPLIPKKEWERLLRELITKTKWNGEESLVLAPIYIKEGWHDDLYLALYEANSVLAGTDSLSFIYGFDFISTFKHYAKYLSSKQRKSIVRKVETELQEYAVTARRMPQTAFLYENVCNLSSTCKEGKIAADTLVAEFCKKYKRRKVLMEIFSRYNEI